MNNCNFSLGEKYKSWQVSPESYSTFNISVADVYSLLSAEENMFWKIMIKYLPALKCIFLL